MSNVILRLGSESSIACGGARYIFAPEACENPLSSSASEISTSCQQRACHSRCGEVCDKLVVTQPLTYCCEVQQVRNLAEFGTSDHGCGG